MFYLLVGCWEFGGQLLPQLLQLLQQQRLLLLQRDTFPLKLLLQLLWTTTKNPISQSGGSGGHLRFVPCTGWRWWLLAVIIHTNCKITRQRLWNLWFAVLLNKTLTAVRTWILWSEDDLLELLSHSQHRQIHDLFFFFTKSSMEVRINDNDD